MEEDKIEEVGNVDVEVEPITEPITEPVIDNQPTQVDQEILPEIKPKKKGHRPSMNRGPLTEKDNCPDCNKLISKHNLIYKKHKCTAKKNNEIIITDVVEQSPKM